MMFFRQSPPDHARAGVHFVNGRSLDAPVPHGMEQIVLALGCFWGAERVFWQTGGVYVTQAGYAGGSVPDPGYQSVCTGKTGHAECVRVVHDPATLSLARLLVIFWESHDPTQGMRQGNDVGSQYRSAIYTSGPAQQDAAMASRARYQAVLDKAGYGPVTTAVEPLDVFYPAEDYHQQYLAKNPGGYCDIGGTGVSCPLPQGSVSKQSA